VEDHGGPGVPPRQLAGLFLQVITPARHLDCVDNVSSACSCWMQLPSREHYPDYYVLIAQPLALTTVRGRFALPFVHFILDLEFLIKESAPLFLKRQCDPTLGAEPGQAGCLPAGPGGPPPAPPPASVVKRP
jgi:hypothetical protein